MIKEWLTQLFAAPDLRLTSSSDGDHSTRTSEEEESESDEQSGDGSKSTETVPHRRLVIGQGGESYLQQHATSRLLEDDYFQKCAFQKHRHFIAQCYDQFVQHSPLRKYAAYGKRFGPEHLWGLEYLMEGDIGREAPGEFPCIHLWHMSGNRGDMTEICRPLEGVGGDTFLVNRLLDYIYNYIIDLAYLSNRRDARLPPSMHALRQQYRAHRMAHYEPCHLEHHRQNKASGAQCPQEWVLYTKKSSPFFKQCLALLERNQFLDYGQNFRATPISYNLVSFLCGPFLEACIDGHPDVSITMDDTGGTLRRRHETTPMSHKPIQHEVRHYVTGYDQWVIVPLYFIDLWSAMHHSLNATDDLRVVVENVPDNVATTQITEPTGI